MRFIHYVLFAIILGLLGTSAYARNDGGENGAGCINNCGNGGGGGDVVIPPQPPAPAPDITNSQHQTQAQESRSSAGSNAEIFNGGSSTSYTSSYDGYVAPAYAPPLTTGHCMGSASAGGSGAAFGFSLGKTYIDENCNARYDSILLHNLGLGQQAILRQCQRPAMAEALGDLCPEKYHRTAEEGRWWAE